MSNYMKNLSFFKTLLLLFAGLLLLSNAIRILSLDIYDASFWNGFLDQAMIVFVLAIILAFGVNWLKDIRQSGRYFTWIGGRFKILQVAGVTLLLLLFVYSIYGVNGVINEKPVPPTGECVDGCFYVV